MIFSHLCFDSKEAAKFGEAIIRDKESVYSNLTS